MLWRMVVVCAYLNMKLSKPTDKRPMQKLKQSIIDGNLDIASGLGLRKRHSSKVDLTVERVLKKTRRQKKNPWKCVLGEKAGRHRRLLAAEHCQSTGGRRMINLSDHFGSRTRLRCARCGMGQGMGCLSCGVALCTTPRSSTVNKSPVSCMDIFHARWKYNIVTGAVIK